MSLSYAGVSLPVLTPEASAAIESRIPTVDMNPWGQAPAAVGRGGFGLAAKKWNDRPPRIGHLSWPTGASRWATGYFLATDDNLTDIREAVQKNNNGQYGPAPLVIGDGTNSITAQMSMLMARPLLGSGAGSELWLLVLVDQRYFWWTATTINQIILKYYTSSQNPYNDLLSRLPSSPSFTYDTPALPAPPLLMSPGQTIPDIIDWMSVSLGQRFVVDLQGKAHAYNASTAQSLTTSNTQLVASLVAGGKLALTTPASNDLPSLLPQSVQVDFLPPNYGLFPQDGSGSITVSLSTLSILPGAETNNTTVEIQLPSWTAASTANAQAWASAYYQWLASASDYVYAGVVNWTPTGLEDWIDWEYNLVPYGVKTRIHRSVYEFANNLPPVPIANVKVPGPVIIRSITLPGGTQVKGYSAYIEEWDNEAGTWSDRGAVWFKGPNDETPVSWPTPTSGYRYCCRLLGAASNGQTIWTTEQTPQLQYVSVALNAATQTITLSDSSLITAWPCTIWEYHYDEHGSNGGDNFIASALATTAWWYAPGGGPSTGVLPPTAPILAQQVDTDNSGNPVFIQSGFPAFVLCPLQTSTLSDSVTFTTGVADGSGNISNVVITPDGGLSSQYGPTIELIHNPTGQYGGTLSGAMQLAAYFPTTGITCISGQLGTIDSILVLNSGQTGGGGGSINNLPAYAVNTLNGLCVGQYADWAAFDYSTSTFYRISARGGLIDNVTSTPVTTFTGTFTAGTKTVTVSNGIITSVV